MMHDDRAMMLGAPAARVVALPPPITSALAAQASTLFFWRLPTARWCGYREQFAAVVNIESCIAAASGASFWFLFGKVWGGGGW